jgi:toxin ParE1/3/4
LNEVVWTEPALVQLLAIRDYIGQFNPRAARHVADGLKRAGDSLANFPRRGRLVPKTDLRELITAYPYVTVITSTATPS